MCIVGLYVYYSVQAEIERAQLRFGFNSLWQILTTRKAL